MIRASFMSLAAAAMLVTATGASAQAWRNINQRQENLYQRIEQGVRSGALNRREAQRLRTQFTNLERRERDYRRSGGGLSRAERADLNARFDRLSARVHIQKRDYQTR